MTEATWHVQILKGAWPLIFASKLQICETIHFCWFKPYTMRKVGRDSGLQ